MFSGRHQLLENNGAVFIDRDPTSFLYLITYLRNNQKIPKIENKYQKELFQLELLHWSFINEIK